MHTGIRRAHTEHVLNTHTHVLDGWQFSESDRKNVIFWVVVAAKTGIGGVVVAAVVLKCEGGGPGWTQKLLKISFHLLCHSTIVHEF